MKQNNIRATESFKSLKPLTLNVNNLWMEKFELN